MPIQIGQRPDHSFQEPLGLLSDCHRRIEHFLKVLCTIAEAVGGGTLASGHRAELESALKYFKEAAPRHTADEEESLFPRLRASADAEAQRALDVIARLERDHGEADRHHAAVHGLVTRWLAAGSLDAPQLTELREHLSSLRSIYDEHIGIEDRELFPAAGRVLSREDLHAIGREMAARRSAATTLP